MVEGACTTDPCTIAMIIQLSIINSGDTAWIVAICSIDYKTAIVVAIAMHEQLRYITTLANNNCRPQNECR